MTKQFFQRQMGLLVCIAVSLTVFSQSRNVKIVLSKIKSVPSWYEKGFYENGMKRFSKDSTYNIVSKMDSVAIIRLMGMLSDTSETEITNPCTNEKLTYGQLAFMLINDIEHVPIAGVTRMQWCVHGECGSVPDGFWDYLKNNSEDFENHYRAYFNSKERIAFLNSKTRTKTNQKKSNKK